MERLAHQAAEIMSAAGAEDFDVYLVRTRGLSLEAREGRLETATRDQETGLGLRAFSGRRMGAAFTFDLSPRLIRETADKALSLARLSQPLEVETEALLALPPAELPEVETVDQGLDQISQEVKTEVALKLERTALEFDPRVVKVRRAGYHESRTQVWLVNSRGLDLFREATLTEVDLALLAREGEDSQMGYDFSFSPLFGKLEVEGCARRAAARALERLGAGKARTGRFPVVIDNTTAAMLLSVLAPALLAENVRKGKSLLAGKEGRRVFSRAVTIVDDGLYPLGAGTRPFDDEGSPSQRTEVVTRGEAMGLLYDLVEAARAGRASTGNGRRAGPKSPPGGAVSNLFLQPAEGSLDDLVSRVEDGFLITELLGLHTADPISGDFSLGALGTWIENGGRTFPVQGAAISGNLMDLFDRVAAVGGDLRFMGNVGSPSLLLDHLDVAG